MIIMIIVVCIGTHENETWENNRYLFTHHFHKSLDRSGDAEFFFCFFFE